MDTDHDGGNGGQVGWAVGYVTGSSFTYSIPNVPAGSYMVYAIVYSASVSTLSSMSTPGSGDYVSGDSTILTVSGTGTYTANRTCAGQYVDYDFLRRFQPDYWPREQLDDLELCKFAHRHCI